MVGKLNPALSCKRERNNDNNIEVQSVVNARVKCNCLTRYHVLSVNDDIVIPIWS